MTRIDRSPEQLDAEAAARLPLEEQLLDGLIADHRAAYLADLSLTRLHVRDGDDSGIGLAFNPPFAGYVDWDRRTQQAGVRPSRPGPMFPWSTAFYAQWAECRRSHPEHHGRPEWRGSLCRQLVSFTIRREMGLIDTCLVLGLTPARASRTLRNALLWIEGHVDRQRKRAEQRHAASKPTPSFPWRDLPDEERIAYLRKIIAQREPAKPEQRHDQPGLHKVDCHRCHRDDGIVERSCRACLRAAA